MKASAIYSKLKADSKVQSLLEGFQTATGIPLALNPATPLSISDLTSGAHGRRFCKCLPDASEETQANCLRTHTELRITASVKGAVTSRVCLAGLVHAAIPITVGGNPVAVLEITALAPEMAIPVKLTDQFRHFLQKEREAGNAAGIGKILDAFENLDRRSEREIAAIFSLVEVLARWISLHAANYPDVVGQALPAPLVRAIDFARKGYSEAGLTAAGAAAQSGITTQRLAQLFRKFMGMTFGEWIVRYRLSMAMAQLRGSQTSILDISAECGFGTVSSFYRSFQRFTGVSPKRYRLGDDPTSGNPLL